MESIVFIIMIMFRIIILSVLLFDYNNYNYQFY